MYNHLIGYWLKFNLSIHYHRLELLQQGAYINLYYI